MRSNRKDKLNLKYGKGSLGMALIYGTNDKGFYLYDFDKVLRTSIGTTSVQYNDGSTKKTAESAIWLFDQNGNGLFNAPN